MYLAKYLLWKMRPFCFSVCSIDVRMPQCSLLVDLPLLGASLFVFNLQAMLLYIYSDALPDIHELTGSVSMSTSTIVVQHLLAAADRFGLDRLKQICEAKLCEEVTADTVATTLALAEQHHCAQLKSACLKFTALQENLGGL